MGSSIVESSLRVLLLLIEFMTRSFQEAIKIFPRRLSVAHPVK